MSMVQNQKPKPIVRHLVRQISSISNPAMGYRTVEEVNEDIGSVVAQGYRLVNTHYLGAQRDQERNVEYMGVLYILVLEQGEIEKVRRSEKATAEA